MIAAQDDRPSPEVRQKERQMFRTFRPKTSAFQTAKTGPVVVGTVHFRHCWVYDATFALVSDFSLAIRARRGRWEWLFVCHHKHRLERNNKPSTVYFKKGEIKSADQAYISIPSYSPFHS